MKIPAFLLSILLLSIDYKCNNPSKVDYPVYGIDISHHQGYKIKWDKLKEQGISFVYMKSTEGRDFKDSMFVRNWEAAKKIQVRRGAYHFFLFCRSGKEQAQNFIETVELDSMDLPPVLDLEYGGKCKSQPNVERAKAIAEMKAFLEAVEAYYCVTPIIYTTNEFYEEYIEGDFHLYDIWIRDVLKTPSLPDERDWTFWQYNVDKYPGVKSEVDLNVFNGSPAEFDLVKGKNCE